jgi:hypothetical protein
MSPQKTHLLKAWSLMFTSSIQKWGIWAIIGSWRLCLHQWNNLLMDTESEQGIGKWWNCKRWNLAGWSRSLGACLWRLYLAWPLPITVSVSWLPWVEQLCSTTPFCHNVPPHHQPRNMELETMDWHLLNHKPKQIFPPLSYLSQVSVIPTKSLKQCSLVY